jgi:hypothetical protein
MKLKIDTERGNKAAELLYSSFSTTGIHGNTEMPEDTLPKGVLFGSLDHLMFITLTVSIDYQRDATVLWNNSRLTFEDPETRYLFDPGKIFETPISKIIDDMKKYQLSKKIKNDPFIWRTVALTFLKKWNGNPILFLEDCEWDAPTVLARLKSGTHLMNGRETLDFPFLRGNKIGPLWLRMLRDNIGIKQLKNLESVPIPVDIHVARASFCLGVVQGSFYGNMDEIFPEIRAAWFESVKGHKAGNRPMIALDIDEPLWHLSKYGCTMRNSQSGECPCKETCELQNFCIPGVVDINRNQVNLST